MEEETFTSQFGSSFLGCTTQDGRCNDHSVEGHICARPRNHEYPHLCTCMVNWEVNLRKELGMLAYLAFYGSGYIDEVDIHTVKVADAATTESSSGWLKVADAIITRLGLNGGV